MLISINNSLLSTIIFEAILLVVLVFFMRKKTDPQFFPLHQSQELKGLAILLIVFSHIGYFLVTDNSFLFPLSIMAGVGVDLFLFLSGLGLTASAIKNKLPALSFYKKNLLKLFVPFWLALGSFLLLDFFVLKIDYSSLFVTKAFFGIFTTADLYKDINSPLWYFTLIIFYYLLFPVFFSQKRPWLSAIIVYLITYGILRLNIPVISGVSYFYARHVWAFPLGIIAAWLFYTLPAQTAWMNNMLAWFKKNFSVIGYWALVIFLMFFSGWFAYYYGNQKNANATQLVSIITVLVIIWLFSLKKVEFKLLYLFGIYSYEIYLLHWPIMYRYDFLYKYTPAWLATILYLALFIGLGWVSKQITSLILRNKK